MTIEINRLFCDYHAFLRRGNSFVTRRYNAAVLYERLKKLLLRFSSPVLLLTIWIRGRGRDEWRWVTLLALVFVRIATDLKMYHKYADKIGSHSAVLSRRYIIRRYCAGSRVAAVCQFRIRCRTGARVLHRRFIYRRHLAATKIAKQRGRLYRSLSVD